MSSILSRSAVQTTPEADKKQLKEKQTGEKKRDLKEEHKKKSRKSVWDLISYIDIEKEDLIKSKESGLKKLWGETKSPNPLKQNLFISESLLFNQFKQAEFERVYRESL